MCVFASLFLKSTISSFVLLKMSSRLFSVQHSENCWFSFVFLISRMTQCVGASESSQRNKYKSDLNGCSLASHVFCHCLVIYSKRVAGSSQLSAHILGQQLISHKPLHETHSEPHVQLPTRPLWQATAGDNNTIPPRRPNVTETHRDTHRESGQREHNMNQTVSVHHSNLVTQTLSTQTKTSPTTWLSATHSVAALLGTPVQSGTIKSNCYVITFTFMQRIMFSSHNLCKSNYKFIPEDTDVVMSWITSAFRVFLIFNSHVHTWGAQNIKYTLEYNVVQYNNIIKQRWDNVIVLQV